MLVFTETKPPVAECDVVVVGSGFGGSLAAHELLRGGARVVMVERGDWVARGPHNWAPDGVGTLTPHYSLDTPYRVLEGGEGPVMGAFRCVGGPSVFYGGVSLRFRSDDFRPAPEIVRDSGALWPFDYDELEPWYTKAERLIGVAGESGDDPTEPPHSAGYPQPAGALSPTSRLIWEAARDLGLHPFRLPLAFNHARTARAPALRGLWHLRSLRLRDRGQERPGHRGAARAPRREGCCCAVARSRCACARGPDACGRSSAWTATPAAATRIAA